MSYMGLLVFEVRLHLARTSEKAKSSQGNLDHLKTTWARFFFKIRFLGVGEVNSGNFGIL